MWAVEEPLLDGLSADTYPAWLDGFNSRNPEYVMVRKVPPTYLEDVNPEEELQQMLAGSDKTVIVVSVPNEAHKGEDDASPISKDSPTEN
jgi:hypothetical protein